MERYAQKNLNKRIVYISLQNSNIKRKIFAPDTFKTRTFLNTFDPDVWPNGSQKNNVINARRVIKNTKRSGNFVRKNVRQIFRKLNRIQFKPSSNNNAADKLRSAKLVRRSNFD